MSAREIRKEILSILDLFTEDQVFLAFRLVELTKQYDELMNLPREVLL